MFSPLELKIMSYLVGVVRGYRCPCCGGEWSLKFAGRGDSLLGDELMVAQAVCPGCSAELEVGKYLFGGGVEVVTRPFSGVSPNT